MVGKPRSSAAGRDIGMLGFYDGFRARKTRLVIIYPKGEKAKMNKLQGASVLQEISSLCENEDGSL